MHGSTRDEVLTAYPQANAVRGAYATAYGIDGERGRLVVEVLEEDWGAGLPVGQVYLVRADPLDWELTSLSGGDLGGWCAIEG